MINVELHVIGGKHSGQVIKLTHKKFLIGREQDCHLRPNSEMVSRHHCIFTLDDFSLRLRDLGSTNGTLVNGEALRKEAVLQPNDLVLVGNLEFKVVINEGDAQPIAPATSSASHEDTIVAGSETLTEMQPIQPTDPIAQQPAETAPAAPQPAAAAEASAPAAPEMPPANATPAAPIEMIPQASSGDTTIIAQPMMMPGQQMYPGMPQMGYPMYPNYQYPGMPPQMPMHPGQMMPGQMMPGYGMPGYPPQQPMAPAQAPPAEEPTPSKPAGEIDVSLPDPAQTGLKAPPPPPPKAEGEAEAKAEEKSNASAAAIIQKHMQRRPGG